MPSETELKYSVSSESREALLRVDELGGYALDPAERKEMHDIYSDTPDRAIRDAGFAFRIRSHGDVRLACLKSLGRGDGVGHRREEYECEIGAGDAPAHWPDGEARRRFLEITDGKPLRTEVEIRQTRITRMLRSGADVIAEMSLDEVQLDSATGQHTFFELEIELVSEIWHEALERLNEEILAAFDVCPVETSKYERAMALVSH